MLSRSARVSLEPEDPLTIDAVATPPPPRSVDPLGIRLQFCLFAAVALFFPLFSGGRAAGSADIVKSLIYLSLLVFGLMVMLNRAQDHPHLRPGSFSAKLFTCAGLFAVVVVFQLIPLTIPTLSLISSRTADLYRETGAIRGRLSLDYRTTISELFWFGALSFVAFWLSALRLKDDDAHSDRVVDLLQKILVAAGVVCSLLAVSHQALHGGTLVGKYFAAEGVLLSKRAHFPFTNPNHLAVLLEITLITAWSRLLRLRRVLFEQRAALGWHAASPLGIEQTSWLARLPPELSRQLPAVITCTLMLSTLVLTLSKAGIALGAGGCAALYLICAAHNRRASAVSSSELPGPRLSKGMRWEQRVTAKLKRIAVLLSLGLLLFLVLGETGREKGWERLDEGLAAGVDEIRVSLNSATLSLIADFLPLGVGLGCWHTAVPHYITPDLAQWALDFAHNDYLQLLAEVGIAGVLPLLLSIGLVVRELARAYKRDLPPRLFIRLLGSMLAVALPMLHAFIDFPFHVPALSYLFALALVPLLRLLDRE